MSHFQTFAAALAERVKHLSKYGLFVADIDGQSVWDAYLAAFPEGTNPIYRVRAEHDGSYDRNFVRRMGNVVALVDGEVHTIWGIAGLEHPYNEVAAVLDAKVKQAAIRGVFRSKESKLGYVSTVEQLENGSVHRWYHFHAELPAKYVGAVDEQVGKWNTHYGVFARGLDELTLAAIDTVADLIGQNALYRGAEFKPALDGFRKLKLADAQADTALQRGRYRWEALLTKPLAHTLIRNTAFGQLLIDLSAGEELETAVRSYERIMAPTNYRRPTALITQRMVDDAAKTIADLGLEPALARRHATLADISINDVLWVNNDVQSQLKGGVASLLAGDVAQAPAKLKDAQDISVEDFLKDVLPKASSIEAYVANPLKANLVSLTTAVDPTAPSLFKWGSHVAWAYTGNIADSIRERVKTAGGNVDAKLRVSLAWFNRDDLDLHSHGPDGHTYFGNKQGILDVDMNAGSGTTRSPVENQSWKNPRPGSYRIVVKQYTKRESSNVGFTIELAYDGQVQQFSYDKAVNGSVECLQFQIDKAGNIVEAEVSTQLSNGGYTQDVWVLKTETFVKVNTLLHSPNHWEGESAGNKHLFFILDGCRNDEPVRGVFNEFLRPDLAKHSKVFEVLGNRTKCEPTAEQLSGLGFSLTQRNTLTVRVKGTRLHALYNIKF